MRTAVLLTGALRTIKKSIRYHKQNLNADVFLCVQNDTDQSNEEWTEWFSQQINHKSITWFSLESNTEWTILRDKLLHIMPIDQSWKNYLRASGSMIEYIQLQTAYNDMCMHEQVGQYDYIVKARTDSIFTKPIDFHWLNWTNDEVNSRLATIRGHLIFANKNPEEAIQYFMATMVSDDVIPNIRNIEATCYMGAGQDSVKEESLHDYIKNGRYILTFRKNNLYIVRRALFQLIPALATMYGQFRSPYSDAWWFNAEGQFTSICYHACITTYDYYTNFEDKSVEPVGWNESMFFDNDGNLTNEMMLFCMIRK